MQELKNVAFTIIAKNYLKFAIVLRESFLKHNPDFTFKIYIMDMFTTREEYDEYLNLNQQGIEIHSFQEVRNSVFTPELEELLLKFDVLEMNTTIKPVILEHLLNFQYDKIFYIDPDILFTGPLTSALDALDEYEIVLTPHMLSPYKNTTGILENAFPNELDILFAGVFNLGFIGVKNSLAATNLAKWWQEKLFKWGHMDVRNGMHTDQNWMQFAPCYFEKTLILRDKGYNVAYWNLHERCINKIGNKYFIDNEPLVFFHFSGFPANNLETVSKHQARHKLSNFPDLISLFEEYKFKTEQADIPTFKNSSYFFGKLPCTEVKIPDFARRWYLKKFDVPGSNLFNPNEIEYSNFVENMKSPVWPKGKNSIEIGALEMWRRFSGDNYLINYLERENDPNLLNNIYDYFKFSPDSYDKANTELKKENFGFNIFGFFELQVGSAEVSRSFTKYLYNSGVPYVLKNLTTNFHERISEKEATEFRAYYNNHCPYERNIVFANGDLFESNYSQYKTLFKNKPTSAIWWWEFDDYFPHAKSYELVDSLIVYTDFVKSALEKASPGNVKIEKCTYPYIKTPESSFKGTFTRLDLNIPKDSFVLFFNYDYYSCAERKNPYAIVKSFSNALSEKTDAYLILKSVHCSSFKDEHHELLDLIQKLGLKDKVKIIDEPMNRPAFLSLLTDCDCYISLHRSEGLGIGLLEAMSYGKAVIATNYGGNTEFMNENNSLLVNYNLKEVEKNFGPYKKGWLWADPNTEHASELIKKVYSSSNFRDQLGNSAKISIEQQFNRTNFLSDIQKMVYL